MKAIFTSFFATNLLYRIGALTVTGQMTTEILVEALAIIPAVLVGSWLGIKLFDRIPREVFRWFVVVFIFALGLLLIFGISGG